MCPENNTGQALSLTLFTRGFFSHARTAQPHHVHLGILLMHQESPAPPQGTDAAVPPCSHNPMLGHESYYTGQKHISGEEFKMPVTCLSKAHRQLAAEEASTQQVSLTDATGMYQCHVP